MENQISKGEKWRTVLEGLVHIVVTVDIKYKHHRDSGECLSQDAMNRQQKYVILLFFVRWHEEARLTTKQSVNDCNG